MGDTRGVPSLCLAIDYYDANPSADLQPGDIWHGLPTLGLFRTSVTAGLVVTPACDLQNEKVETITYLPITPVSAYLTGIPLVKRVKRELTKALTKANIVIPGIEDIRDDFGIPPVGVLEFLDNIDWSSRAPNGRDIVQAAVTLLRSVSCGSPARLESLAAVIGDKELKNLIRDIITNRREDSHFLPRDPDLHILSPITEHSVVSFRHPLTIPLEILQAASTGTNEAWEAERRRLESQYRMAREFARDRPIKKKRLKEAFLKDLLTRFTRLYTRLGSPDFHEDELERFRTELLA